MKVGVYLGEDIMLSDIVDKEYPQYLKSLRTAQSYEWLSNPTVLIIIFIIPSLILYAVGRLSNNIDVGGSLLGVAAILASMSALMITIIIFSINIHRLDIPGSDSLLV